MAASRRQHRYSNSRILLPADRLPRFQVGFSASNSGRPDGVCRFGLADLYLKRSRQPSIPLQSGLRPARGTIADPVAPGDGSEYAEAQEKTGAWGINGRWPAIGPCYWTRLNSRHSEQSLNRRSICVTLPFSVTTRRTCHL